MAFEVGDLVARLKMDTSGFTQGLSGAESALGGLKSTIMTLGIGAVFLGIAKSAFDAASKMEQVERAFAATFGDLGDKAQASAEQIAGAFKLNLSDVQERMAKTQRSLEGLNFKPDVALQMNEQLEKMSLDLASLWGQRPEEVSQKLTMGLMGATRGLRSLGMAIDDNVLKHVALKYHVGSTGEAFSRQQKAMLTYLAILDRSGKAAGDFGNNLNSGANRLYLYKQALDDLMEALGKRLMPVMTGVLKIAADLATGGTSLLTSWSKLPGSLRFAADALGLVAGAMLAVKSAVIITSSVTVLVSALTTAFLSLGKIPAILLAVRAAFMAFSAALVGLASGTGAVGALLALLGGPVAAAFIAATVVIGLLATAFIHAEGTIRDKIRGIATALISLRDLPGIGPLLQLLGGAMTLDESREEGLARRARERRHGRPPTAAPSETTRVNPETGIREIVPAFQAAWAGAGNGGPSALDKARQESYNSALQEYIGIVTSTLTPTEQYQNSLRALAENYQQTHGDLNVYMREMQRLEGAYNALMKVQKPVVEDMKLGLAAIAGVSVTDILPTVGGRPGGLLALDKPTYAKAGFEIGKALGGGIAEGLTSVDIGGALANVLTSAFAALGTALEQGAHVWQAFKNAALGAIGSMMQAVGAQLIQYGILVKLAITNPLLAIGAGIALVTLGAMLSSTAQRAVSGGATGGGGGIGGGSYSATGTQGQQQGSLTIVFPARGVFDPGDPQTMDAFVNMMEQASGRNVIVQRRA